MNRILSCLTLLVLTACAATPQILPLTPDVPVDASQTRGLGRTMTLEVSDGRGSKLIGYRDPSDPNTAITSAPEMLANIRRKLEAAYAELGFTILPAGEPADVALHVQLTELGYEREAEGVVKDLRTGVTVHATSVMHERTVNGTYRDAQTKDTVLRPSLDQNAKILNAHLDAALTKLVADPRLTSEK